jgi:hypothetical protein
MTCREFETAWNDLLDASGARLGRTTASLTHSPSVTAERELALSEHEAECAVCNRRASQYQTLRRALHGWDAAPIPPDGFVERVLAEVSAPTRPAWHAHFAIRRDTPRTRAIVSIVAAAAAACLLLMVRVRPTHERRPSAVLRGTSNDPSDRESQRSQTPVGDMWDLDLALADATAATWDLARSASEPAARISRQMLDVVTQAERNNARPVDGASSEPVAPVASVPSLDSLAPDTAAAGAMLQQVGDRFATGVRPLSDTARHAFGFLLGAPSAKPEAPAAPPSEKGV